MRKCRMHVVCALAVLVAGRSATAAPPPPPPTSLNTCQNAVKVATAAFVKNKVAAIGTCLQAVSTQIVKNNAAVPSGAASSCVTQFRKLNDTRGLNKQLSDKLAVTITKKCAPGQPGVTHTLADIIGAGAGVPEPLKAENLNAWCSAFGGDGTINTLQEWIDCLTAAVECDVDSTLASQYPRAIEWLNAVKPSMEALSPPAADTTKIADAVAGLDAVKAEIDGPSNDNAVSIQCGGTGSTCGDGVKNGPDACDGSDLGGQTCTGLGYVSGTLTCAPTCVLNVSGCVAGTQGLPKSGQTTAYGTGSDGDVQAGRALSYTDNGDGTITDNITGLMWEKKDDSSGIHAKNSGYTWSGASYGLGTYLMDGTISTTFLAALNSGGGFAGYTDWRIPNVKELQSIVDYDIPYTGPTVNAAFHKAATCTGCTDVTAASCSCTASSVYWSSSTYLYTPGYAWYVGFHDGNVGADNKSAGNPVRAVRGGL